jgi:hypothetical protein
MAEALEVLVNVGKSRGAVANRRSPVNSTTGGGPSGGNAGRLNRVFHATVGEEWR